MKLAKWGVLVGLGVASAFAQAVPIAGLVNTGAGLGSDVVDTNYAFAKVAGDATAATGIVCTSASGRCGAVANENAFPIGPWLGNTPTSTWLTPSTDQGQSYDASVDGKYTWSLSFNLTGFVPSTASLAGRFASDNGATVQLNGGPSFAPSSGFTSWTGFSTNTGFISGVNTLKFTVTNDARSSGNPTGLRVEFIDSNVSVVPEPEAYGLALAGMAVVGVLGARRRRTA